MPYAGSGSSAIVGQAFMKTQGGDVKFGAGNQVTLTPVTPFTAEWYRRAVIGGENLAGVSADVAARFQKYERRTVADGSGNFEFRNIPAGEYYVTCPIFWQIPGAYTTSTTGGMAHTQVTVGQGETKKVVVTR
jgi:hypothetical protein